MIEKENIERCSAMLCDENAVCYLFIMLTNDKKVGLDVYASINEMAAMLANAAIKDFKFRIAMERAFELCEKIFQDKKLSKFN